MAKEYETKVLDINVKEIEEKLKKIGAKKESDVLMKRWVFDIDPSKDKWIRLRDDGKKTTLTYKYRKGSGISETEEIEVEIKDFNKMAEILSKLNFRGIYYQENKRKTFKLGDIIFTIDSWPRIPSYLEIESSSEEKVKQGLDLIGLKNKDVGNISVKKVYLKYGINLHSFKELKF